MKAWKAYKILARLSSWGFPLHEIAKNTRDPRPSFVEKYTINFFVAVRFNEEKMRMDKSYRDGRKRICLTITNVNNNENDNIRSHEKRIGYKGDRNVFK